ncbi:unnamed protein product [Rotaria magnacalcarata]|uniref:Uncharacterized protein n=1 Tax=Rotaria magnacalcarata TaxID=392030 RepID=A0A816ZG75_9BILA|nr:unnamed protein product [Rotaria magnacalcarata]CAF4024563.1 unnamed protein product [Rotaria magnacalcarata]
MESIDMKSPCVKCSKGCGITTCNGCQQAYCINHFNQHRQELAIEVETLRQKHDRFRSNLDRKFTEHPLLLQINQWEQDAVNTIQTIAETARALLRELLNQTKNEIEKSMKNLTDALQSSRECDDYTEINIKKWTGQLRTLRETIESPPTILITENEKLVIPLISVHNQPSTFATENFENHTVTVENSTHPSERFDQIVGKAITSEECRVITCNTWFVSYPTIYGSGRYSSGTHRLDYQIEKIGNSSIFFGITSSLEGARENDENDTSVHGWWDLARTVVNGEAEKGDDQKFITTGDEVTLTIDCDDRQIQLQHHQTRRQVELNIDIEYCPLPWKTVIKLGSKGDCIRILE